MAQRFPTRPAIQDLRDGLTYRELAGRVREVSAAATDGLADRPGPVAVLLPLDARFPVALLGVAGAGRAAVLLDPEHPAARNRRILAHAGAAAVITCAELAAEAEDLIEAGMRVLDIDTLAEVGAKPRPPEPGPDDLAYILYTSGSTGAPKGVVHTHANALNDAAISARICDLTVLDATCVFYAATMGCVRQTLGALLYGSTLHVLPARELGADRLVDEMRLRRISLFQCVPTLFRRIAKKALETGRLDGVRIVRLIGDRCDWGDLDLARRAFSVDTRLEIALGSTECSSTYAQWFVDEDLRRETSRPPVGRPVAGVDLAIVGEGGEEAPDGQAGEAVVSSQNLALGYWREPGLTAGSFRCQPSAPGVRVFATGDICRRRADGLVEFIGRKDRLVKLRGHRLEPAEVEAALRQCPGVADGVVMVRWTADGRARALAAYVELEANVRGLRPRHIQAMMSRQLPAYMTPSAVYIGSLPRLPNFKADRMALEALDRARAGDVTARASNPLLDEVARTIEEIVGCSGATPEDDLLSLGGDSLLAVEIGLELERRFQTPMPEMVFRNLRNIAELSAWISAHRGADATDP